MPVRMPTPQDLRDAGRRFGFDVHDEEVDGFSQYIREMLPAYRRLDELVAPTVPVKYPRRDFGRGRRPRTTGTTAGRGGAPSPVRPTVRWPARRSG